jgi:UDP-N-acetylmuramoyl-L-alanyl-D-glutamate--2,6-diaminopimelate ligase
MKLAELLPKGTAIDPRTAETPVSGLSADSRTVKRGDVFVAIAGSKTDGLRFVNQAVAAGAAAVVSESVAEVPAGTAFVRVPNARRALALMAAKMFPRQPGTIAAVTGTSGKTSVAAFTRQIWTALGHRAASVGTIGIVSPRREIYGSLTTPDPVALHRALDELTSEGITHLALEASSHGLDQHRLDGLRVSAGGFTNLSRDHLDYHQNLDAYFQAKLRLFDSLITQGGTAVIAGDHEQSAAVIAAARARGLRVFTVGRRGEALRVLGVQPEETAQRIRIAHEGHEHDVRLPLMGAFQIENALVAAGLAIATGGKAHDVFAAIEELKGAKGRLEPVGSFNGAPIFIDYAHKPDALSKALEALRPYVTGRLVVVFGAGGDRDPGKRAIMGEIAARMADRVIITDDNPRSENPATIRAEIRKHAPGAIEIADRGEAIHAAVADLRDGDVLLIAGKGHETGQIVGDRILPFSDHEAVAAALKDRTA